MFWTWTFKDVNCTANRDIAFKHKVEDLRMTPFGEEQEKNIAYDSFMFFSNSYGRDFQTTMKC